MAMRQLILLLVLAASPAFSQTVFMGHHIGESVPQFLAAEPGLQSNMDSCRAAEPKPMTPEQIHALSKQDANALAEQVFANVLNSPDTQVRIKLKRLPNRGEQQATANRLALPQRVSFSDRHRLPWRRFHRGRQGPVRKDRYTSERKQRS
jgi:DNA-binding transcriptional regulator YiaG